MAFTIGATGACLLGLVFTVWWLGRPLKRELLISGVSLAISLVVGLVLKAVLAALA